MKAVIQCGGQGTRLRPYTMVLPKPLMPVRSQPVLELLLKWLRRNDLTEVYITTGYLGQLIKSFCGDGRRWDIRIRYTDEAAPLGTIGPLGLLRDELDTSFLVINGDVITDLSLGAFAQYHHSTGGLLTVATMHRQTRMDFGVIEAHDGRITSFKEKPILSNLVSMGVYCMEPSVLQYIPAGVPFGFDDLILCLLRRGVPTHSYIHEGMWLDIGRIEDFQTAQELDWDVQSPPFERVHAA
ncbi:sugar phosphate nucleotidyltransferase [Pararhizobium sp. LjRoot235]|uniref:nucleotidyltransferase family protein n=1 Tax=Pararhizobium sp. LjRoot235 TaxID=3342291 RepID=UPI003ECF46CE